MQKTAHWPRWRAPRSWPELRVAPLDELIGQSTPVTRGQLVTPSPKRIRHTPPPKTRPPLRSLGLLVAFQRSHGAVHVTFRGLAAAAPQPTVYAWPCPMPRCSMFPQSAAPSLFVGPWTPSSQANLVSSCRTRAVLSLSAYHDASIDWILNVVLLRFIT
jgi:hypothetical protein